MNNQNHKDDVFSEYHLGVKLPFYNFIYSGNSILYYIENREKLFYSDDIVVYKKGYNIHQDNNKNTLFSYSLLAEEVEKLSTESVAILEKDPRIESKENLLEMINKKGNGNYIILKHYTCINSAEFEHENVWFIAHKDPCNPHDVRLKTASQKERVLLDYFTFNKEFLCFGDFSKLFDATQEYVKNFSIDEILSNVKVEVFDIHIPKPGKDDHYYIDKIVFNGSEKDGYINSIIPNTRKQLYSDFGFTSHFDVPVSIKLGRQQDEENMIREKMENKYSKSEHFKYCLYQAIKRELVDIEKYRVIKNTFCKYWSTDKFKNNLYYYNVIYREGYHGDIAEVCGKLNKALMQDELL